MGIKTHELLTYDEKDHHAWLVWCPACDAPHNFDKRWTFDGNHEAPTFDPSMLVHDSPEGTNRCHSYLRAGVWEYLDDCGHAMKGQHVPAPDWSSTRWARMRSDGVVPD
jgi:hypothetical protein